MNDLIESAISLLEKGEKFIEATMIDHQGSTPRSSGTKMLVGMDGRGYGTIGGGLLEATVMKTALDVLESGQPRIITVNLTGKDAADSGMICGGRSKILLDCITPENEIITLFRERKELAERDEDHYYLTIIKGREDNIRDISRALLQPGREDLLPKNFPLHIIADMSQNSFQPGTLNVITEKEEMLIIERSDKARNLFLFGAGHVAFWISKLAAMVGFSVTVLDDRSEFANSRRFPDAGKVCVIRDFESAFSDIQVKPDDFIVIVTRGHLHDRAVLEKSLKTDAAYIGLIGSRRKRDTIYKALKDEGFNDTDLERVYSPIGLEIHAETPEEIGISIIAQMILQRALMSS